MVVTIVISAVILSVVIIVVVIICRSTCRHDRCWYYCGDICATTSSRRRISWGTHCSFLEILFARFAYIVRLILSRFVCIVKLIFVTFCLYHRINFRHPDISSLLIFLSTPALLSCRAVDVFTLLLLLYFVLL